MVGACVFVMGLLGHCTKKLTPENFWENYKDYGHYDGGRAVASVV